jgi:FkbM family methyltransferase
MQSEKSVLVAGYVRVLPAEQANGGLRIEEQRHQLETYVAERGWELAGIHQDEGIAARPRNQPSLRALLRDLTGVDKVVILRFDRLGRSLRRTTELMQILRSANVDLVSIEDDFDTGGATGRAIPELVNKLAEWEWWEKEGSRNGWYPENLAKPGFSPATVIDVGAAHGTRSVYEAFPDANHVLIDPLLEFEGDLRRVLTEYRGEYIPTAVGEREGTVTMEVCRTQLTQSSIPARLGTPPDREERMEHREVPVTTLDRLNEERNWIPPFGLKIDAEGSEQAVIKGAARLLTDTQFVLAEVSGSTAFATNDSFEEFIALMQSHGFRMCDVLHMQKAWHNREVAAMDIMFRRTSTS